MTLPVCAESYKYPFQPSVPSPTPSVMAHYSAIDPQNPVHPETYAGPGYEKSRGGSGRKWLVIGVPVAILVIAGAVVGGILGSRAANKNSSGGGSSGAASEAAASSAASVKASIGVFATATNSQFMVPIYPTAVSTDVSFVLIPF